MALNFRNLENETRRFMVEEIDMDAEDGRIYLSSYLSAAGQRDWTSLLRQAAEAHDDVWLGRELRRGGRLNETARRRKPKGDGFATYRVPANAHETLSEGEFNRFYIRGLCRRAINENIPHVIVYRAKPVENPRPESQRMIDAYLDPTALLGDLREHVGIETSTGFPGPNSGISVRLP